MKAHKEVEIQLHTILTLALHGDEWSVYALAILHSGKICHPQSTH
jgi:hypothetical protein